MDTQAQITELMNRMDQLSQSVLIPRNVEMAFRERLGIGGSSSGTHLRYKQSSAQSISNSSTTTVKFDTKDYDVNNEYSTSTGLFTATSAGYYLVSSTIAYTSAAWSQGNLLAIEIFKNSTPSAAGILIVQTTYTTSHLISTNTVLSLAIGDTIKVTAYQNQGGAVTLYADAERNFLTIDAL